jgi:hypothetical protein
MEVREKLDPVELQRAVLLMSQAQRVEFMALAPRVPWRRMPSTNSSACC